MQDNVILYKDDNAQIEKMESSERRVEIGQWYWIKDVSSYEKKLYAEGSPNKEYQWFACITKIGSNYAKFGSDGIGRHSYYNRIHFNDFSERVLLEENPEHIINLNLKKHQKKANDLMLEVRKLTARLGVNPQLRIEVESVVTETALAVQNNEDIRDYENALIKAEDEELPKLFEQIKSEQEHIELWMGSNTIALSAEIGLMQGSVSLIKNRIENVGLYAGLTEEVLKIKEGEPGVYPEKIHLMQRRLYMDEECLLDYRYGGMEFADIKEFDVWMAKDKNMKRCLPFSKCITAFQVRRERKDRNVTTLLDAFINFQLEELDKATFLYIRNGEQLYRLNTDLDFGEMIFPDMSVFDPQVPMMFESSSYKLLSRKQWEFCRDEEIENRKKYKQWKREHPEIVHFRNPFYRDTINGFIDRWEEFSKESVYYDDVQKKITDEINQYNRIALIIQGLLDRSATFHPHPVIKSWAETDFQSMIKLVYDGANTLYAGEKPDFEKYKHLCNESANKDSYFIGQEEFWERKEAEKENNRRYNRSYRRGGDYEYERYHPYGNPGPGLIAKPIKFYSKSRKVMFEWYRERLEYSYYNKGDNKGDIKVTFTVLIDKLFNVSAYKIGDYKQFFQDPRTRSEYLKWVGTLLTAEEYHYKMRGEI